MEKLKLNLREVGAISVGVNTEDFQKISKLSKNRIKCFINGVNSRNLWNHTKCYNVQLSAREDADGEINLYFVFLEEELTQKEKELSIAEIDAFNERIEIFVEDSQRRQDDFDCFWGEIPDEDLSVLTSREIIQKTKWARKTQSVD